MGWNPLNWQITDTIQGQDGGFGLGGGAIANYATNTGILNPGSPTSVSNLSSSANQQPIYGGTTTEGSPNPNSTSWFPGDVNNGPTAQQIADQQAQQRQNAEWDRQINSINQNLGVYAPRLAGGLSDIDNRFNESKRLSGEQRTKARAGYDTQDALALQGRTRGYEQVDNYANKSANSLSRLFQGANAGNSSVARLLAPKLVGQASDSRRLDVTETANQNIAGIKSARDDAESQFDYSDQDIENNRGYEKQAFEKGITQEEINQYNERGRIEREAGRDASGSQAEVDRRMGRLGELFGAGSFNPQYQVKAVAPKAVSLNDYKVDPMSLKLGQQQQGGSFYAPQLKKKNELRVR